MIKLEEFESDLPYGPWLSRGCDVWDAICAAVNGDAGALGRLLERDSKLAKYDQPLYFAVREGHLDAAQVLLDTGADSGEELLTVARDRGHERVAQLLEETRARRGRIKPAEADHPIHVTAAGGDAERVRALLDAEPQLVHLSDRAGGTPLHRAVAASAREVVKLLLDRGADLHALHGAGPGSERGYAAVDLQPIDLAFWSGPFWGVRGDIETARLLLERGATYDLVIASALGDFERVQGFLDEDPKRIAEARPSGKRALSSAVEFGHEPIVRMLLDRGADPNWPEGSNAPRGAAVHAAARVGNRPVVELLLAHGADPNLPNWQHATPLHDLCGRDARGRPRVHRLECAAIFLDAGATISAKDEDYRSTPLAWAARCNLPDMVEFLLSRGAPTNLPNDKPWATPLAWATKRGHQQIIDILRVAGAKS